MCIGSVDKRFLEFVTMLHGRHTSDPQNVGGDDGSVTIAQVRNQRVVAIGDIVFGNNLQTHGNGKTHSFLPSFAMPLLNVAKLPPSFSTGRAVSVRGKARIGVHSSRKFVFTVFPRIF